MIKKKPQKKLIFIKISKYWPKRYFLIGIGAYLIVLLINICKSYYPYLFPLSSFIALIGGFSFLFCSGFWITYVFKEKSLIQIENSFRVIFQFIFHTTIIISVGLITIFFYVSAIIIIFGIFNVVFFYFFIIFQLISIIISTNFNFKESQIIVFIRIIISHEIHSYTFILQIILSVIWFLGYLFNLIGLQIMMFIVLSILTLTFIKTKLEIQVFFSLFIILLFTRIFILRDHYIVGNDSISHYEYFLTLFDNPKLIFSLNVGWSNIAPLFYTNLMMLNIFGGPFILSFTFIGINILAYVFLGFLILKNSNFYTGALAFLFITIEYTSFRFGFEVRPSILAFLLLSLWGYSIFQKSYNIKDQFIHFGIIIMIILTHVTTALIVIGTEIVLSLFLLGENLIIKNKHFRNRCSKKKYPWMTKYSFCILIIGLVILLIFPDFLLELIPGISWILDVILGKNPFYLPVQGFGDVGLIGAYLGPVGFIIVWIGRIMLASIFCLVIITSYRKVLEEEFSKPEFRLLLYILISFALMIFFTLFFPFLITSSRIYVLIVIPIGVLLGLSGKYLNKKDYNLYFLICLTIIFFNLYTGIRYPEIFYLETL